MQDTYALNLRRAAAAVGEVDILMKFMSYSNGIVVIFGKGFDA